MSRRYKKAPLIEAVCQFNFTDSQAWDWTVPGLVYDKIQADFPEKQQVNVIAMKFDVQQNNLVEQNQIKMLFSRRDKTATIGITPHILSISLLPSYAGWRKFKKLIIDQLNIYITQAQPGDLARIGLRYINRIDISLNSIELEDFFQIIPRVPEPIPQIFPAFLFQLEIPYYDIHCTLRLVFVKIRSELPDVQSFVLDMDLFTNAGEVPAIPEIEGWLDKAHGYIEAAFLAAFTEKTHVEIFEEVRK